MELALASPLLHLHRDERTQRNVAGNVITRRCDALTGYTYWSETYDDEANPLVILDDEQNPLRRRATDHVCRNGGTVALDLCCGTGRHIRELESRFPEVHAADGCHAMLRRAAAKRMRSDTSIWRDDFLAWSPQMEQLRGRCDFVLLALAAMHFADLDGLMARIQELLAPGGVLHVSDAADQFLLAGSRPHFIRQRGEIQVDHQIDHSVHQPSAFARAIELTGMTMLESTQIDFDDQYLGRSPYFRKYRGLRCLFAFNASKSGGMR